MASKLGLMKKREAVDDRLRSATNRLQVRGVDVGSFPDQGRDRDIKNMERIEHTAALLEACLARIDELMSAPAEDTAKDEAPAGYEALTVPMLRDEIARRGLVAGGAKNKANLIFVLEEDDTAPDVEEAEPEFEGVGGKSTVGGAWDGDPSFDAESGSDPEPDDGRVDDGEKGDGEVTEGEHP